MKTKILLFAAFLSMSFFIGCTSNEKVDTVATTETITTDDAIANSDIDASVDDVSIIAEDQFSVQQSLTSKTSEPVKSILPACATIKTDITNDTFTKTIDFGTQGCTLHNGNIVKGKIIISFTKNFLAASKTISYTLEGFYHNGKLIEGSKTIIREIKTSDLLDALHPVNTHSIDVKVTTTDGKVYTRTGTRVKEMIEGMATIGNWEDNVFKVWGYDITTFPNGSKYTRKTEKTQALLFKMSCKMPFAVKGVVEILKNNGKAILDYGNGECDDLAKITVNDGAPKEIHLKK